MLLYLLVALKKILSANYFNSLKKNSLRKIYGKDLLEPTRTSVEDISASPANPPLLTTNMCLGEITVSPECKNYGQRHAPYKRTTPSVKVCDKAKLKKKDPERCTEVTTKEI